MTDRSASQFRARLQTPICKLLGIRHPVVLGGMGSATSPDLVSAVSNAGGLGTLGVSSRRPDEMAGLIRAIRGQTSEPFGINFLLFAVNDAAVSAALAEKPPIMSFAWAWSDQDLKPYFDRAHAAGALVTYMVSNVSDATRAVKDGADVIIAQGSEGGGHVGLMGTMPLVPMVVSAVTPIPVLAAGGIADGRGLAAALALGADGVLLGTRFLASPEAPISSNSKAALLASDGHDTVLTEIPDLASASTWPGAFSRVRRNGLIAEWSGRENELRRRRGEAARNIAEARAADDADRMPLFFGQDAGLIDEIIPAGEIVRRIVAEAEEIIRTRLASILDAPVPVL